MKRATFANIRIRNRMCGDGAGWDTLGPDGASGSIFDMAMAWRLRNVPLIVMGGWNYGTGSSRDWAARGTAMLGVQVVIARSFERIHRANLIGMGVLPLLFSEGESWETIGVDGEDTLRFLGLHDGIARDEPIRVEIDGAAGKRAFLTRAALLTPSERSLLRQGGIHEALLAGLAAGAGTGMTRT